MFVIRFKKILFSFWLLFTAFLHPKTKNKCLFCEKNYKIDGHIIFFLYFYNRFLWHFCLSARSDVSAIAQQIPVHAEPCEAIPSYQGGYWVGKTGVTTFKKGVFKRLVFDTWKSCKLPIDIVKDEATKMSSGCVYTHPFTSVHAICVIYIGIGTTIFISAWAIGVARSTISGNARASRCGMSSESSSHAFFICR